MTHKRANQPWRRLVFGLSIVLTLLALTLTPAAAQTFAPPAAASRPFVLAVPPYGSITVAVNGHCLDYGLPFPGASLKLTGLASDPVRAAIAFSLANDAYTAENLPQAQQAVWHFTNKLSVAGDKFALAQEIVTHAQTTKPSDLDTATISLVEAVQQGLVSARVGSFQNVSNPAYFGKGALTITNLTDRTQALHLPYGMVFQDASKAGFQKMAIFPASLPQAGGASVAAAQSACQQATIALPAAAATKLLVQGYCQNYGLPFPSRSLTPLKLAPDMIRNTICYNETMGYVQSDMWQAQLAIWRQTDHLDKGAEFPLVNEIAAFAASGVQPGDIGPDCISLPDAVEQKIVSAQIGDYTDISDKTYFGKGTLVIVNLTAQPQKICIPYGTVFKDAERSGTQDMAIFLAALPAAGDVEAQTVPEAAVAPEALPTTGAPLAIWLALIGLVLVGIGAALQRLQSR